MENTCGQWNKVCKKKKKKKKTESSVLTQKPGVILAASNPTQFAPGECAPTLASLSCVLPDETKLSPLQMLPVVEKGGEGSLEYVTPSYSLVQVIQMVKTGPFTIHLQCVVTHELPSPAVVESASPRHTVLSHPHVTIATGSLTPSVESLTWM